MKKLAVKTGQVNCLRQGEKGAKGARMRSRDWSQGVSYLEGKDGESFYDVVVYRSKLYLCLRSHVSAAVTPQEDVANNGRNWAIVEDWAFIATRLLLAERIKAGNIDTDNLVVRMLKTAFEGPRVEIAGTMMQVFGNTAANIRFGVNEDGYSVLEYYDNDGRKLYDLGPSGITSIPISEEQWREERLKPLPANNAPGMSDIERIFNRKDYKRVLYSQGIPYYMYYSKKVGPSYENPDAHYRIFVSRNLTSGYIPDGWYVSAPSSDSPNAGEMMQWLVGGTGRLLTQDDIEFLSPHNEDVYDSGTIYVSILQRYQAGVMVETVHAFWNG